ncbi:putative disease resistance RPP13-like protein 1 [Forsythia ovata]|uniref:Disease resistance RPP13-like protein 1 n=1 Tax=Forsythia ovata TaxID=205694 RepID=A0ABD1S0S1_9LAMI
MDYVVTATIEFTLEKLLAIAAEEFNLLRGFKQDLANLTDSLLSIKEVLEDADRRQVTDGAVKRWLKKLEGVAYDADNVLDEIKYENLRRTVQIQNQMKPKVCLYFSFNSPMAFRWNMAHKINNMNVNLKRINEEAGLHGFLRRVAESAPSRPQVKETDAITADPVFVGRENDESKFVEQITGEINDVFSVLPIVGMGGIGKTTLARRIFNHPHTETHFNERIWVCVSENFDVPTILKSILVSLKETSHGESRQAVMDKLREKLKDKKCLLVLDDLWNEKREDWDDLKNALMGVNSNKGNVIIVTTRNESVALIVNPHNWYNLEKLSEDDCWSIIKAKAFEGGDVPEHFQTIGKEIAQQCRGSPLAANMMGAVLRGKEIVDWESIQKIGPSNIEADQNSEGCRIEELGHLKNLRGQIEIRNLQLVNNKAEAKKANLDGKTNIIELKFCWRNTNEGNTTDESASESDTRNRNILESNIHDESVLEGLQPHPNLRSIVIEGFRGKKFPLWTMKMLKLDKLINIGLRNCYNCEKIPMLGYLPLLKYLKLEGLTNVRSIGLSFYGAIDCSSTSRNDGQETQVSFLSLKSLIIKEMHNLTEWVEAQTSRVQVFPSLEILEIEECCKLTNIISCSNLTSLVSLRIVACTNLAYIPYLRGCRASLKQLDIRYCHELRELPDDLGSLESLETLRIVGCDNLQLIPYPGGQKGLSSLRSLVISWCKSLSNLPSEMLESCTSLQSLKVYNCENLTLFLELSGMGSLRKLGVRGCKNITSIPELSGMVWLNSLRELKIGGFSNSDTLELIENIKSIQILELYGRADWVSLPYKLQNLTSMEVLKIDDFGIEELPDWLGNLSSLEELILFKCEKLRHLPSKEAMQRLTKLTKLTIWACPLLKEQCLPDNSEWPKISHIPQYA